MQSQRNSSNLTSEAIHWISSNFRSRLFHGLPVALIICHLSIIVESMSSLTSANWQPRSIQLGLGSDTGSASKLKKMILWQAQSWRSIRSVISSFTRSFLKRNDIVSCLQNKDFLGSKNFAFWRFAQNDPKRSEVIQAKLTASHFRWWGKLQRWLRHTSVGAMEVLITGAKRQTGYEGKQTQRKSICNEPCIR